MQRFFLFPTGYDDIDTNEIPFTAEQIANASSSQLKSMIEVRVWVWGMRARMWKGRYQWRWGRRPARSKQQKQLSCAKVGERSAPFEARFTGGSTRDHTRDSGEHKFAHMKFHVPS